MLALKLSIILINDVPSHHNISLELRWRQWYIIMKKYRVLGMLLAITASCLVSILLAATEQTDAPAAILLPGVQAVRVKFPDAARYIEIHSIRSFPEGAEKSIRRPRFFRASSWPTAT